MAYVSSETMGWSSPRIKDCLGIIQNTQNLLLSCLRLLQPLPIRLGSTLFAQSVKHPFVILVKHHFCCAVRRSAAYPLSTPRDQIHSLQLPSLNTQRCSFDYSAWCHCCHCLPHLIPHEVPSVAAIETSANDTHHPRQLSAPSSRSGLSTATHITA